MDNPGDLMHLCRLCLVKDQVNIPIFEEHGDIRQIFVKISSCLPVKVSKDDQLPKRICDGCSNKLDLLYEFCNTSANSEKKLLSWLEQAGLKDVDTISAVAQHTAKPLETQTQVKQEALEDIHAAVQQTDHLELTDEGVGAAVFEENAIDESDEPPPPKRARRTAAVKAQINITPDSDDDDDMDISEPMTKVEDESDDSDVDKDPSYVDVPGTSADDQPGPSGVGKDGVEAPATKSSKRTKSKNPKLETTTKPKRGRRKAHDSLLSFDKELNSIQRNDSKKERKSKNDANDKIKMDAGDERTRVREEKLGYWSDNNWSGDDLDWKMDEDNEDIQDGSKKTSKTEKRKKDKSGLCPKCGKVAVDLRSHMKSHTNVFSCDLCFINFKKEKHLLEHKEVHETENPYNCDRCNMIFKNVTKLALHRFIHTQKYACPLCGFIATSKFRNSIVAHIKRHEDNYTVRCEICKKGFLCKKKLEEHMEWHENIPKYECEICHKKFPVKSYLKLHHKFNHKKELFGTEEIFQCELCGRKFTFEKSFKRHLSCIHKIGKDFTVKCPVCHKIIANNHNLKKHMRVHTGERNYSCDTCGKTFSQKQYVTRHQKVHRTEKESKKESKGDVEEKIISLEGKL